MKYRVLTGKIFIATLFQILIVVTAAYAQDNTLSKKEKKAGWELLFDGHSVDKWKGAASDSFPKKGWSIADGTLFADSGTPGRQLGGDIVTKTQFEDFEFMFDFKLTEGANSGVKYTVHVYNPPVRSLGSVLGPEFQVLDDERHPDAKAGRDGDRKLGSLYDILPANTTGALHPIGSWNTARIISKGNHVEHWLNGVKVLEYDISSDLYKSSVALSKFKPVENYGKKSEGYILLQDHGDKVFFKNLKIRKL